MSIYILHCSLIGATRPIELDAEDQALLDQASDEIQALNAKYKDERSDIFFLFHRPRRWNPQQRVWMGHERKRGKLADFDTFLRHGVVASFLRIVGETGLLSEAKYVITLDTDTQLPRNAARQLVATMAHPLNRPCFNKESTALCEGYCILQPRVALSLPAARRSWFVRIFGGQAGIDPYTGTVSVVYQDLFSEGSFNGKGIYDVDAFERLLGKRFPDNLILSHDLLEGCHARSGLVTDIELFETFPSQYSADASRRHRWIRGDWQIAMWASPWVPHQFDGIVRNPLSALSRWKIFDNLRRSLVPVAIVALLAQCWMVPLGPAWFWTLFIVAISVAPIVLRVLVELVRRPTDLSWRLHLREVGKSLGRHSAQAICVLTFLADEAYYSADAVLRTLVRLILTKRNLLQWRTSSDAEQSAWTDLAGAWRAMWMGPLIALFLAVYLIRCRVDALEAAFHILALWLSSPAIAWWLSRPLAGRDARLNADDQAFLEERSRTTWRFFETFFTPEDNWLPPDNYQEYPAAVIAHRTSPTNIGLALLSNLAAFDFGYISAGQLQDRTSKVFATLKRLERFRGHFFNWYDTRTLEPLPPRYVSTVDSGNLVGHLLTLREGLLQLADQRILPSAAAKGLTTTLRVLIAKICSSAANGVAAKSTPDEQGSPTVKALAQFNRDFASPSLTLDSTTQLLTRLVDDKASVVADLSKHADEHVRWWAGVLTRQAQAWLDDVSELSPLATLAPLPSSLRQQGEQSASNPVGPLLTALDHVNRGATLIEIARLSTGLMTVFEQAHASVAEDRDWLEQLKRRIETVSNQSSSRIAAYEELARTCLDLSDAEFGFLFDDARRLLTIGFNVTEHRRDGSFYDLLASEARLASFVAIAEGQLPQENWFALGRLLTSIDGTPALLSWSGSMFEYLMPLLVMPEFDDTLLDQTCRAAVARQIAYGASRNVPWGISEAGYNATDVHMNYQYRAFGVPGLGFKRGLADDLVIAPYASAMALDGCTARSVYQLAANDRDGHRRKLRLLRGD